MLANYMVQYKTDTNPHHPGDSRGFDIKESLVHTSSAASAVAYVAAQRAKAGIVYHDIRAARFPT